MRGAELGEREKEGWVEMFRRGDFPADPVVKKPHFQWGGGGGCVPFLVWEDPTCHVAQPKVKKKKVEEKSEEGRRNRELKQEHQS